MAAGLFVNLSYPKPRATEEKFIKIVRTDTTEFVGAFLPKDAVVTGLYVIGQAASDAGTTATIGIGTTTAANEIMAAYDVKTAATGEGYSAAGAAAVGSYMATKLTADTPVYAKYAESGGASTTGGPWFVKIEYVVVGSGEDVQM
jgi:hypothetical protein